MPHCSEKRENSAEKTKRAFWISAGIEPAIPDFDRTLIPFGYEVTRVLTAANGGRKNGTQARIRTAIFGVKVRCPDWLDDPGMWLQRRSGE